MQIRVGDDTLYSGLVENELMDDCYAIFVVLDVNDNVSALEGRSRERERIQTAQTNKQRLRQSGRNHVSHTVD
jgi:hypothetical protein